MAFLLHNDIGDQFQSRPFDSRRKKYGVEKVMIGAVKFVAMPCHVAAVCALKTLREALNTTSLYFQSRAQFKPVSHRSLIMIFANLVFCFSTRIEKLKIDKCGTQLMMRGNRNWQAPK